MSTATVQQTCPDWCNKMHRDVDTSDPSEGVVHARSAIKVSTSDPLKGEETMTVYAEMYPSGHTDVVITTEGRREVAALSPVQALALASALQATAGPLADFAGEVAS